MSVLNYNHLRLFHAVAREGNLTRAAERLNLSPSALSAQIAKLEDRLGHRLFERHHRRLELTEAGRIAFDHSATIFATGDDLVAALRQEGGGRILRVGALATLSRNFQLAFLAPLLGRPDAQLDLRSGSSAELLAALATLALDVVLLNQPPPADLAARFITRRIAEQPIGLVGTPARLAGRSAIPDLLAQEPLVLPAQGTPERMGFDALADRLGLAPRIAAEVEDMAMMRLLVRADAGLGILPPIAIADELEAGLLVEAGELPGLVETFHAVTVPRRFPNPLLALLLGER